MIFRSDRSGHFAIYKQALDQQVPDLVPTGPGSPDFPRVSPDGKWILYPNGEYPKTDRLLRVPVAGGAPQIVLNNVRIENYDSPPRSGAPCIMCESSRDGKQNVFSNFDPLTGLRSEAFRTGRSLVAMKVSANGTLLATIGAQLPNAIEIRSRAGQVKLRVVIPGWPNPVTVDWAADGKSLFVSHPGLIGSPSEPVGATFLRVELNGRAEPLWDMRGGRYAFAVPSPDGRYVALRGATTGRNAWLLESF